MRDRPQIDFIYIESGGGHRAAALALEEVIRRQHRPWDVHLRSAQTLFDSIDIVRKLTGIPFQEIYNIMLRRGWTLGTAQLIRAMHAVIRALHNEQVRVLAGFWRANPPDMVVSLIPHYNRAMFEALAIARPGTPLVTVLTDMADYPPCFWIERQPQYVVCGTEHAARQARSMGYSEHRVFRASGMVLHPRFYETPATDRARGRERLGLDPARPTGIVLFGGEGSMDIVTVANALNESALPVQLIVLCGRHERARAAVDALPRRIPCSLKASRATCPRTWHWRISSSANRGRAVSARRSRWGCR